ncbi:Inositol monophosphatase [Vibrio jasicida]|uniref:Inositol monophosphatase n=1 Tax=Vibrio jasicida TaxID=766224 RepID=A0AAU9QYS2_9VIBR|nr:Inositol monophosphatase [Vibrio jasicida]CAH1602705.1 Inositol monophosphatase [Vibrio jasicida]
MSFCQKIVDLISQNLDEITSLKATKMEKADGSFVSKGDLLVQELVFQYCNENLPEHQLISEEFAPFDNAEWDESASFVVLDPIDGTENFVSGLREWGVGISIYTNGVHQESCIYLPELREIAITGQPLERFSSRIHGLSSSLSKQDLEKLPEGFEYRIIGCSMYNMLSAVKGSYARFENVKGVNCWDVLPGLNLALEHNVKAFVDGVPYQGQILFPTKKYKILLEA